MKNKMNMKTRYVIVMVIGVLMNQLFYTFASYFNLPVWLDMCGTAVTSIVLEPAAGIIVGFINNFYLSIIHGDISTIIYFAVSAAVAVICGVCMRDKQGKVSAKRILPTFLLVLVISTVISSVLTIWRNGGIPDNNWEIVYFNMAKNTGVPQTLACFFGTGAVKCFDTLANAFVVAVVYFILPNSLKNKTLKDM